MSLTFDGTYDIMFSWIHAERGNLPRMFYFGGAGHNSRRGDGGQFLQGGERRMGRPLKYKTAAELVAAIDDYFEKCRGEPMIVDGVPVLDKGGRPVMKGEHPPTVTGLALALGFTSRQALLNYQGRKAFVDAVTRAKTICEEYAESRLYDKDGFNGARFSLTNNFKGWRDRPEEKQDQERVQIIDDL